MATPTQITFNVAQATDTLVINGATYIAVVGSNRLVYENSDATSINLNGYINKY
jgi:hypothetical protein